MRLDRMKFPLTVLTRKHGISSIAKNNNILSVADKNLLNEGIEDYLDQLAKEVVSQIEDRVYQKRLIQVLIEMMQNVARHGLTDNGSADRCMLFLGIQNDRPYVITGNVIASRNIGTLSNKLDAINKKSNEELKTYYRDTLENGEFSVQGGAGLGLIDIARKARGGFQYAFTPISGHTSYFTLKINVNHT